MSVRLINGDCREVLLTLPNTSVQCCVTSPPYFGLRSYIDAEHPDKVLEIGSEETPDEYVATLVEVFREVWRVLRDDGTVWLNLGDSYAGNGGGGFRPGSGRADGRVDDRNQRNRNGVPCPVGIKPKDLLGIPWMVAFTLQQPYVVPDCIGSESDRAWLAAMFDGEGCIGIRRFDSYREDKKQVYQDGFVVYTVVTNNDVELLERCITITGKGRVSLKQSAGATDGRGIVSRRDSYAWRLDGNDAIDVVRAIYPYLIAKRRQACLANALDIINKNKRRVDGRVPVEDQERKVFLHEGIKLCNQRQSFDLPSWVTPPERIVEPGWYLRSAITWAKPNPMPESCTDRPTGSYEMVFLLAKRPTYFYDADAISEPSIGTSTHDLTGPSYKAPGQSQQTGSRVNAPGKIAGTRNSRNVWTIATQPFSGAHFATMPPDLAEKCIKAGTSEAGACPHCGSPWERIVEKGEPDREHQIACGGSASNGGYNGAALKDYAAAGVQNASDVKRRILEGMRTKRTTGWRQTCSCPEHAPRPCVVLDPFAGSGTTGMVADRLGRDAVLIELKQDGLAQDRITQDCPLFAEVVA